MLASVSHRQSLSVTVSHHKSLLVPVSHCPSLSVTLSHRHSLSVTVSHCIWWLQTDLCVSHLQSSSVTLSHRQSLSVTVSPCQSLSVTVSNCQSLYAIVIHCHSLSVISFTVTHCKSLPVSWLAGWPVTSLTGGPGGPKWPWSKKRYVTDGGPQMTFDVKIVTENLEDLYFHSSFKRSWILRHPVNIM